METSNIDLNLAPIGLYVTRHTWIYYLCLVFSFFNTVSMLVRVLLIKRKINEIMSWQIMVDLLTCIPFIASLGIPNGKYLYVPYFFRALIIIKRIRRLIFIQLENHNSSRSKLSSISYAGLTDKLSTLICAILVLLYVSLCTFEYVEAINSPEDTRYKFMPSFYLMVVTGSTVGFGDITPKSTAGKFVIIAFIFVTIIVLPTLVSSLVEAIRRRRQGGGVFKFTKTRFVVIFGLLNNFRTVVDIIDFFSNDLELEHVKLLLVGTENMNEDVFNLISLPIFAQKVIYLKGSALNESDLSRAKLNDADAAFVICDRYNLSAQQEDEQNCLRLWSLKRFAPNTKVYSVIRTPQAEQFQQAADVVICVDIIKSVLLAFSCLNPGASTFFTNLMNAFTPATTNPGLRWIMEYHDGCCNDIYNCQVAVPLEGFPFYNLVPYLFQHFQVLLIGVRIWSKSLARYFVFMNPYNYRPNTDDKFIVIAQNRTAVDRITHLNFEIFNNTYNEPSTVVGIEDITSNEFPSIDNYVHDIPYKSISASKKALCHLLLFDCPLQDRILQSATHLKDHILVIPKDFNLATFIIVLRSAILSELFDILVLFPRYPTRLEYRKLQRFPCLYFVAGNPRNMNDLENAGALTCSKVVIFSQFTDGNTGFVKDFEDAPALLIKHSITILWKEHNIIEKSILVELTERRNVHHLSCQALQTAPKYKSIKTTTTESNTTIESISHEPIFAAGGALVGNLLENIIFHAYKGSHAFELVKILCGFRLREDVEISKSVGIRNGYMFLECIPTEYIGMSFFEFLRQSLIIDKRIAVALYRTPNSECGNELPFIYTAPIPTIMIKRDDMALFIGNQ